MTAWVFDVDGVLCDTGQVATEEFKAWFLAWSQDKQIYLVTGGQRDKTILQLGSDIVNRAQMTFNCMGNSVWINGHEVRVNQFQLTEIEQAFLDDVLKTSAFPIRAGRHVDMREGSMNFSVVGRDADLSQRAQYREWDQHHQERALIAEEFVHEFPRFEAYLGGDISIDICLTGANKGRAAEIIRQHAQNHMYFFGDKCYPGGIDEPFAVKCSAELGDRVFQVSGFHETWKILKDLE